MVTYLTRDSRYYKNRFKLLKNVILLFLSVVDTYNEK